MLNDTKGVEVVNADGDLCMEALLLRIRRGKQHLQNVIEGPTWQRVETWIIEYKWGRAIEDGRRCLLVFNKCNQYIPRISFPSQRKNFFVEGVMFERGGVYEGGKR